MCLVEVKGSRTLQASCVLPATDGMEVRTTTPAVREARKVNLELILSNHDRKCLTCVRSQNCELQALAEKLGVEDIRFEGEMSKETIDDLSPSIVRDPNKWFYVDDASPCAEMYRNRCRGATERV